MTTNRLQSAATAVSPAHLQLGGVWGKTLDDFCQTWMLALNEDLLLDGFRQRPGIQAWIGEHIGKFMLGAIPAAALLNSEALQAKVSRLAEGLVAAQEDDGYLGTYVENRFLGLTPENRRDVWDIWVHKYCILSLLAYHDATGWQPALCAASKAGDRLLREFGVGARDLNRTDQHQGLASGSVLEPIVGLYQATGEQRFMDFATHIVEGWDTDEAPGLLRILRARGDVATIGNGKAYEMMSCFVGLLEYARETGHRDYIEMVLEARNQLADTQRYPTGGMSSGEYFLRAGALPESADIETCVTFTWIQLNLRLYELCGDERSLDLVEEAAWNQLLPAFSPASDTLSYFLAMTGPKRFFRKWIHGTDGSAYETVPITCCHNNGHRGLAGVPQFAYAVTASGTVAVNFYGKSSCEVDLPDSGSVRIEQHTDFPHSGAVRIEVFAEPQEEYEIQFRVPPWAHGMTANGIGAEAGEKRVCVCAQGNTRFELQLPMEPRVMLCGFEARGKCCVARGPLLYALDRAPDGLDLDQVALLLGSGEIAANIEVDTNREWPVLRVPVAAIGGTSVNPGCVTKAGTATLVPIQLAGLHENPGLTGCVVFTVDKWAHHPKRRESLFPEYRVLLPMLWCPESPPEVSALRRP